MGMGNTCKPMAVSFQCMTKIHYKKKKKEFNFFLNKIPDHCSGIGAPEFDRALASPVYL